MPISDAALNGFARSLAKRIAVRAVGMDDSCARIIAKRPSDHILTGFLTPIKDSLQTTEETVDDRLAEDLPQDSAYEQTSVGFEWVAPKQALKAGGSLRITVRLAVYVRRLPTFDEQRQHQVWHPNRRRSTSKSGQSTSDEAPARYMKLIHVWTREAPAAPLRCEIDLGELLRSRVVRVDLADALTAALALGDGLAPADEVQIPEEAMQSETSYRAWLGSLTVQRTDLRWRPVIDARVITMPTDPNSVRVALRLANQTAPANLQELEYRDPMLYAVELEARLPREAHQPTIFRELPESYRYDRTMAGIGVNAHIEYREEGEEAILTTETVPRVEVPRLEPRRIEAARPRFDTLACDPISTLQRILAEMREYSETTWKPKLATLTGNELAEATRDFESFQREIASFARGIDVLANPQYPDVLRSFKLMNKVMEELGRTARAPYEEWRLFQIVFIVSQLPILAAREYQELRQQDDDYVDLLWFSAGGGKTEAFLGLIIWQAFFDRIRGKHRGVTAFVRFPLRLLTFQQLQRLSRALGIAELFRKKEGLEGDRFSLGFFVGGSVTDNRIDDDTHRRYQNLGVDERQKRIHRCPFCLATTRLEYNPELRLIEHWCTDNACPGGKMRLPVYIVDDDIYRYLPTVIVSTVDKFAQFGQNQRVANLFGRFDMVCPIHGASYLDSNKERCPAARARSEGKQPTQCGKNGPVLYGPFHDPGPALLVQDELHLLSEELGTFDSHYETAVMELSRSLGQEPWKIIAATATIKDYEHHAWQLYLRHARQFPGPGPAAYESFYYVLNRERIGRIFLGLVGVGRKHTPAVTRTLSIIYLELNEARKLAAQNPAKAGDVYQTGWLEPGDWQRLLFLYELPLTYALTRKGSDQVAEAIESRVKKELNELAPEFGELVVQMFNGGVDIAEMIEAMEIINQATADSDPSNRTRGLVATNIIGHGVDVDRFNIIVFAGFPRLVAEYIQASARVGRTYPGISLLVATPQNERDRGIFNRFVKFHEYLDRLVDPAAVSRWPLPALERTVPGILAGYLMGVAAQRARCRFATIEQIQRQYGRPGAESLSADAVKAWMRQAYRVDDAPSPEEYAQRLESTALRYYATIVNSPRRSGRPTPINSRLGAMRSLREVDDPGAIQVSDTSDMEILQGLIRGGE